jgi:tetratricopeptide (TPR) repeat protein
MHIPRKKIGFLAVILVGLVLSLFTPAMAQGNRKIRGKVIDGKDQPIKDVEVMIQRTDVQGMDYKTKTDKKGEYLYMGIPGGTYRVIFRKVGYRSDFRDNVRPNISDVDGTVIDMRLNEGPDTKLVFEMSDQEKQQYYQEAERAQKRKQHQAEITTFTENAKKLAQEGNYAGAIEEYKKVLERDPEDINTYLGIADAYFKSDKYEDSLATYQKAADMRPNEAAIQSSIGVVLAKMGKNAESQEAFKKAAGMSAGSSSSAPNLYNMGILNINNNKNNEAIDDFKQAIAADPNYAEAYYQLGLCLSADPKNFTDAIKALEKYVEIGQKPDQVETAKAIIDTLKKDVK